MHTLITGLWRNLAQTLPSTLKEMRTRRAQLLVEVEQLDASIALTERTMAAAAIVDDGHEHIRLMDSTAAQEDAA